MCASVFYPALRRRGGVRAGVAEPEFALSDHRCKRRDLRRARRVSDAVSARQVLTLVLLPFFFTTLRVPAMLLLLLWFAVQLLGDFAVHGGAGSRFGPTSAGSSRRHAARGRDSSDAMCRCSRPDAAAGRRHVIAAGVMVKFHALVEEQRVAKPSSLAAQSARQIAAAQTLPLPGTALTAFVGRTLRGPVTVRCSSRSFGGIPARLWRPVAAEPAGYAVEQFFD